MARGEANVRGKLRAALAGLVSMHATEAMAAEPIDPPSPCPEGDCAPAAELTGVVRVRGTKAPVRDREIVVGPVRTQTDSAGRFLATPLPPGTYTVHCDGAPALEIAIEEGERVEVEVWVAPPPAFAREVVLRYERKPTGAVVRRIQLDDRRALPGSLDDPLRALGIEPGIARTPYDAGWLLVRGGDDNDTGIYLDGVRLPIAYHLGGYTSVLHPDLAEGVSFWPGVFPARYGDALSGVVDLVPADDPVDTPRVAGGVNVVFAHAVAQVPTRSGSVSVAARRSYLDGVLTGVVGPEAARIAPRFWDVQAQAHIGETSITGIALSDRIDAPSFDSEGIVTLAQRAAQLQASVPMGALTVRPWIAATERSVAGEGTPQVLQEWYPGLRLHLEGQGSAGAGHVGLETERRAFHFDRGGDERNETLWTVAPYAGLATPGPLSVWTGWRGRAVAIPGRPPLTASMPRGGVRARLGDQLIYASVGRSTSLPPPTLFLAVPDGPYLGLERSDTAELGTELRWRRWQLMAAVWERWPASLAIVELDGSIGPSGASARGIEGRLSYQVDQLDVSVLGQLSRSIRWEDLPAEAFRSPLEQRRRLELVALQRLPRDWTLSGRFRATSGYPRREVEGILVPTQAYDLLRQQLVDLDLAEDDDLLRPYASLDVKVGKRFTFRRWRLTASLDVQNITNRRVVEPVITGFGDARPSYGFGLPILPVLAIDGEVFLRGPEGSDPG